MKQINTLVFYLFVLLSSTTNDLLSQDLVTKEDLSAAYKYKEIYKDHSGIILNKEVQLEFKHSKSGAPLVVQTEKLTVMALRINSGMDFYVFYDDYSTLAQPVARKKNDRLTTFYRKCGDYETEEIFHSDAKFCHYGLRFTSIGEIQKLEFTKEYKDVKYFASYNAAENYPVVSKKVTYIVPKSIEVAIKEINIAKETVKKQEKAVKDNKHISYVFEHMDAAKSERFSSGMSYTYPHFLILTKSYSRKSSKVALIGSMDDQYNWYASLVSEEDEASKSELKTITDNLTKEKKTDIEKIKAIYYWVQDNVRYIAFENGIAGYKPESAIKVYKNKYGDCKGMANLTKNMLRLAGFDSRLTWLGTSSIPTTHTTPFLSAHNHMICTVLLKNQRYFLDPTEKYIAFEDIAERIQGREVVIENGKKYLVERIPERKSDRNNLQIIQEYEIEGKALLGKGTAVFNGERKVGMLNAMHNSKSESRKEILEGFLFSGNKNSILKDFDFEDLTDREIPLKLSYSTKLNNQISSFDDEVYISLSHFKSFTNFKVDKNRVSALDFGEKVSENFIVKLKIPQGYKVKAMPQSLSKSNPSFSFNINCSQQSNYLVFDSKVEVAKGMVVKEEFSSWNSLVDAMNQMYNEPIVLTKN